MVSTKGFVVGAVALGALWCGAETLENGALALTFGGAEEGFGIRSIENRLAGGVRFVHAETKTTPRWRVAEHRTCALCWWNLPKAGISSADFWEVELRLSSDPANHDRALFLDNRSPCRARRMLKQADGATFCWDGVKLPEGEIDVRARVRFAADGTSRWTLDTDLRSETYRLFATHYPFFRHVVRPKEADVLRPRADLGATLLRRADYTASNSSCAFGCLAYVPMMTAFMIGDAGLYIGAHDDRVNAKALVLTGDRDVAFHAPNPSGGFEVTVAAYRGDWWQAAKIYRDWALTAPWCRKGRILDRADYPRRLCEIPLWFNFHGDAVAASNALTRAKELFPDVSAGLHWHRWQAVPWEIGHYPEYFPTGPGVKECIDYCRSIGQEPMVYTLPRLYSMSLLSFHFAKPWAVFDESGTYTVERYGRKEGNPPPLVPMCPAAKPWQDCTVDYCRRILELGGRSVFLDQFASCPARACYATGHSHEPGGGDWFYRGQHEICERVHADYWRTNAFTTAEGSTDQFIDVVDGLLTVTERKPEDVPFWHAVYNGYTTWFCSPENHDDDGDSFWALQTREAMWGQSLGWYHTLLMEKPDKVEIVRKLIAFRQKNLDCLAYGELLGEVRFLSPVPEQQVVWLGRKSFPDWGDPKAQLSPTTTGALPGVLGYVWKSGVTGSDCVILANLTSRPQPVTYDFFGQSRSRTLSPREIVRLERR